MYQYWLVGALVTACAVPFVLDQARANSALERAAEIKEWRAQCQDPDPDLRLAIMEAAIDTGDQSIIRVCLRNALQDDSSDVRNLGLRAAIAAADKLVFTVEIPEHLDRAFKEAGDDERQWREINKWFDTRLWRQVQNAAIFEIDSSDLTARESRWYPLVSITQRSNNYFGDAVVSDGQVVWNGRVAIGNSSHDCVMKLDVTDDNRLDGNIKCERHSAFNLSAPLF